MMIHRREFVAGVALTAVAPTFALLPVPASEPAPTAGRLVLMVDGWSVERNNGADEQEWIRVGHSWRTAWR